MNPNDCLHHILNTLSDARQDDSIRDDAVVLLRSLASSIESGEDLPVVEVGSDRYTGAPTIVLEHDGVRRSYIGRRIVEETRPPEDD